MTITTGKSPRKYNPAQAPIKKVSLPTLAPVAFLALLASPVCKAEFQITPTFGLSETYTDNVNLTVDSQAQREFITEFTPGITISDNGPNLKLNAAYQAEYFEYTDKNVPNINKFQNALQANANAAIVKEFFYIDSAASISQQAISAFGPQTNNNPYSDNNRTEVKTLSFSPYITENLGTTAVLQARYSHQAENSGNVQLGDSQSDGVLLDLASGPAFRIVNWGIQFNRQTIESTVSPTVTAQTAELSGAYIISPELSLTANTGYDEFEYQGLVGDNQRDNFWLAGLTWAPTTRTNILFSGGRRYGGTSYNLVASHHTRNSIWMINYNDSVTTTLSQFSSPNNISTAGLLSQLNSATITDPGQLQQTVSNTIGEAGLPSNLGGGANFFSNGFFLQKQLQASVAFNTAKSTLIFSLFDTERTTLSTTEFTGFLGGNTSLQLNDNNRQLGASSMLNWAVTPRTNFYLNGTYTKIESLSSSLNNFNRAVVFGMTRRIKPHLQGTLELRRAEGTTADGVDMYHENAIMGSLTLQL
jgi:uncharacterized protein (PEP-CTERM system associated)